jgi:excisionase family DNA binding protein
MTVAEKLEQARRLAAELGLPLDGLDRLAVPARLAASLLSVSHSQIEKLVAQGDLPAFQVGRSVRIEMVELVAFIERNRRQHKDFGGQSVHARAIDLIERPR